MYARFKVSANSGDASGQRGLIETINTLATASAGATISAPAGTSYFKLVNNTEAGGHTIQGTTNGQSYGNGSGLQSSYYASIESNTPKNGTNYKKRFEFRFTGSNAHCVPCLPSSKFSAPLLVSSTLEPGKRACAIFCAAYPGSMGKTIIY